ncbi:MAG TPA: histidine kinase [Clostridiales bacterium]|nr:histidine kinase [Clostridiales bacterium]
MNRIRALISKRINVKVMALFIIVLACVLICTTAITNYYSTRFIKEQRVKYNAQVMSQTENSLLQLNNQITQFLNNYNRESQYQKLYLSNITNFDFLVMKQQIEFETDIKKLIYVNHLDEVIKDMIFYYGDQYMFGIGDGVLDKNYKISGTEWYQSFVDSKSQYMVYGPVDESYKAKNTVREQVMVFFSRLVVPSSSAFKTEQKPFVMVSVKFSAMKEMFEQLISGSRGIVVSDPEGHVVYTSNEAYADLKIIHDKEYFKDLTERKKDYVTYTDQDIFITSTYVGKYNWIISTIDSSEELFKDVDQLVRTINIIVFAFGVLGVLIAIFLIKRLMMPIYVLNHLINTIEEETDTYIDVTTNDEIGQIGQRFNQMKRRLNELNKKMYLSEVRAKEAQISALQAQINPHFLYNTLDNIYCIAQIEEIDPIVELTQSLSNIMRYSIDCKDMYTTVGEELKHVENYLNIINVRYDGSVRLVKEIEEGLEAARTIKLLLQPIVENAWVHGIRKKAIPEGIISIRIYRRADDMEIVVEDDGIGIGEDKLEILNDSLSIFTEEIRTPKNKGFGIALINVNDRIKFMNGEGYGVRIDSIQGAGSKVTIRLKYME